MKTMSNHLNAEKLIEKRGLDEEPVNSELLYPTDHLQNFDHLGRATGLYGKPYKPIIKAIWYVLQAHIIKELFVTLCDIKTDCIMNFTFMLRSGGGKK